MRDHARRSALLLALFTPAAVILAQEPCPEFEACPSEPPTACAPYVPPAFGNFHLETLEAKYGSFGSRKALRPADDVPPCDFWKFLFALHPGGQSTGDFPNTWAPLTAQGIYRNNLWEHGQQATQFAPRSQYLAGMASESLLNLESGVGKTRSADLIQTREAKYAFGSLNHAGVLRGGTFFDTMLPVGNASFASVNLYNTGEVEQEAQFFPELYRRAYVFGLAGSDAIALVGRNIAQYQGGEPVDGRDADVKPDDPQDPEPAVVLFMLGASGTTVLDNKRADFCYPFGPAGPTQAGYIGDAWAVRAAVTSTARGSWVNVGNAKGLRAYLSLRAIRDTTPGHLCGDCEREGSTIRSWVGVEVPPPDIESPNPACPEAIDIQSASAIVAYDQTPLGTGGAPLRVRPEGGEGSVEPERFATVIARGDVVIGDGQSEGGANGFNTDVLRVNDVLHLAPRTAPPEFSDDVAPSDRVGLMYFDLSRNCLRISVPAPTGATAASTGDWRQSPVVWMDVALNESTLDPARDLVGGPADAAPPAETLARAAALAESGESPYIQPSVEAIMGESLDVAARSAFPVTFLLSGFQGGTPRMYYKVEGIGRETTGGTGWIEMPSRGMTAVAGMAENNDALTAVVEPAMDTDALAALEPGQIVRFLAVHPRTGQTAGCSVRVP